MSAWAPHKEVESGGSDSATTTLQKIPFFELLQVASHSGLWSFEIMSHSLVVNFLAFEILQFVIMLFEVLSFGAMSSRVP